MLVECLKHVLGKGKRLWASQLPDPLLWYRVDVSEFVKDLGVGMRPSAWLFIPPSCEEGGKVACKLLILPCSCDAELDVAPPVVGSDGAFAQANLAMSGHEWP